ncbi:MAG: hypothetical protein H0U76_29325 [Ktedonobacteraceae bacterium]|nr:hypothetical protein [Ktedonobacteraceae bacterium]
MTNQGNPQTDGFVDDTLHGARQQLEGHIGQVIDQYAGRVPGGEHFTPEAKQAVSGILDGLQRQLEAQAASRLGGLGQGGTSQGGMIGQGGSGQGGSPTTGNGNQQSNQGSLL